MKENMMSGYDILLIDDGELHRVLWKMHFDTLGLSCLDCADGTTALVACWQNHYPFIMTDFYLPDMTGADLCRKIRTMPHQQKTVIVVVSSSDEPNVRRLAIENGANGFLKKPLQRHNICQWLSPTFGICYDHEQLVIV